MAQSVSQSTHPQMIDIYCGQGLFWDKQWHHVRKKCCKGIESYFSTSNGTLQEDYEQGMKELSLNEPGGSTPVPLEHHVTRHSPLSHAAQQTERLICQ